MRNTTLSCSCQRQEHVLVEPTKQRSTYRNPGPQVRLYLTEKPFSFNPTILNESAAEVKSYFADIFGGIRPYHWNDRLEDLATSTSPGSYYKSLGYATKKDVLSDEKARNKLRYTGHRIKTGREKFTKFPCNVLVVDAKESLEGKGVKSRVAWVYPLEVTACENMFFAAIKDRLPKDWVPTPEVYHHRFCGKRSGSADFKNFDTSVPSRILLEAMYIVHSWFDFSRYNGGARPYSQTSLEKLFDWLMDYFLSTPFKINGKGTTFTKSKGVPSGSMFTNIIDTICSRIIVTYLHRINRCSATVTTYGDDCHWRDCVCDASVLESTARCLGLSLEVESPNEHGCLTYCKAECHLGNAFHPGLWFQNILNCASPIYRRDVAECLLHYEPTLLQFNELRRYMKAHKRATSYHSTFERWKEKLREFWPRLRKVISPL